MWVGRDTSGHHPASADDHHHAGANSTTRSPPPSGRKGSIVNEFGTKSSDGRRRKDHPQFTGFMATYNIGPNRRVFRISSSQGESELKSKSSRPANMVREWNVAKSGNWETARNGRANGQSQRARPGRLIRQRRSVRERYTGRLAPQTLGMLAFNLRPALLRSRAPASSR